MPDVEVDLELTGPPAAVWALVGDVVGLADWVPGVAAVALAGDVRTITFSDGSTARERIVEHDDASRHYRYTYESGPLRVRSYLSTIAVHASGQGTRVSWAADYSVAEGVDGARIGRAVERAYRSALERVAELTRPASGEAG